MRSKKVFVSYSHDSDHHVERVVALTETLIERGVQCYLDQYEQSPPEGWPTWMENKIGEADYILVVCTKIYHERLSGQAGAGVGKGAKWEGAIIRQELYDADSRNKKFIPVIFEKDDTAHIPTSLGGASYYNLDSSDGFESLYRRLTDQPEYVRPPLGEIIKMPPRRPVRKPKGEEPASFDMGVSLGDKQLSVMKLGIAIEKRLRLLAARNEIIGRKPLTALVRDLQRRGVLAGPEFSVLIEMIMARNQAAHGLGIDPQLMDAAFRLGPQSVAGLDDALTSSLVWKKGEAGTGVDKMIVGGEVGITHVDGISPGVDWIVRVNLGDGWRDLETGVKHTYESAIERAEGIQVGLDRKKLG